MFYMAWFSLYLSIYLFFSYTDVYLQNFEKFDLLPIWLLLESVKCLSITSSHNSNFVIVPAHRISNHLTFVCRRYYFDRKKTWTESILNFLRMKTNGAELKLPYIDYGFQKSTKFITYCVFTQHNLCYKCQ